MSVSQGDLASRLRSPPGVALQRNRFEKGLHGIGTREDTIDDMGIGSLQYPLYWHPLPPPQTGPTDYNKILC